MKTGCTSIYRSFWITKSYPVDGRTFYFLIGMNQINMLNALEHTTGKRYGDLIVSEESTHKWVAQDGDTKFVVEMRDTRPDVPEGAPCSVQDLRGPNWEPRDEKKPMPKQLTFL